MAAPTRASGAATDDSAVFAQALVLATDYSANPPTSIACNADGTISGTWPDGQAFAGILVFAGENRLSVASITAMVGPTIIDGRWS